MIAARVHLMTVASCHDREPGGAGVLECFGVVVVPHAPPVGGPGQSVLEALPKRGRQRLAVFVEVVARLLIPDVPYANEPASVALCHPAALIARLWSPLP